MKKELIGMVLLICLLISSPLVFAGDDTILAIIGDRKIMLSDFNRITGYYDAEKQKALEQEPQNKVNILKRLVQAMVVSKIARDKQFDAREDIKEQLDIQNNDFLAMEYLKKGVIGNMNISEDDIKSYYLINKDKFTIPETVRLSHIMIKIDNSASPEDKNNTKKKAEETLKRAKAGEDFGRLAAEVSDDGNSKYKGGGLGFLVKGKMMPEFEKAVAALKQGELSDIVETSFGYHIIRVEERKESVLEPFDKVKNQAREMLTNEYKRREAEKFIEKAMADAKVEIYADKLIPKKGEK